jgi:integrase
MTEEEFSQLLGEWDTALAAEGKSPKTRKTYADGARAFAAWCGRTGCPVVLDKPAVRAFTAALMESGSPATARMRQAALRRLSAWTAAEDIAPRDELAGLKLPNPGRPVVPKIADGDLAAMLKACQGKEFRDRRDEAIIRMFIETAARAEELLSMSVPDADTRAGTAVIRRGKGGAGRIVPFGPRTAQAVDRYLRMRRAHKLAAAPQLWLGDRGREFGYHGLRLAMRRRAQMAGVENFSLHRFRHTAASRWLAAGGSEGGLMAVAGWKSRDMLDRYVHDTAMSRAAEEARALGLGEL